MVRVEEKWKKITHFYRAGISCGRVWSGGGEMKKKRKRVTKTG